MLTIEQGAGNLRIVLSDDHGLVSDKEIVEYAWLDKSSQRTFFEPLIDYFNGRELATQKSAVRKFCQLGQTLGKLGWATLPTSVGEWQSGLLQTYTLWLTRDGVSKLESRTNDWNRTFRPYFELLRDAADVIPFGVVVPTAPTSGSSANPDEHSNSLPSDTAPEPADDFVDKLIVAVNLSRSDAEYLEEIRDQLAHIRQLLDDCAIAWWKQIEAHFRYGQKVMRAVDWRAVEEQIATGSMRVYKADRQVPGLYHIANGDSDDSMGNLLAILKNRHCSFVGKGLLEKAKELPHLCTVKIPESAPATVSPRVMKLVQLNWMLGNLDHDDIGFAFLLLTIRNPKITPTALATAKLNDKNGNPYFDLGPNGYSLRVDKHRAHSIKDSVLDDVSIWLLNLILEMSTTRRELLQQNNSTLANQFFVASDREECRKISLHITSRLLAGRGDVQSEAREHWLGCSWIGSYFPKLAAAGIERGSISLRKMRTTIGVLEWFKTGSVAAMARKLGNSTQVAIDHYLPKPLIHAWNTRLIRRYQNLWIAVAAAKEPFLLKVTDFLTLEDLHRFILDMLKAHPKGGSPLATELHEQLGSKYLDVDGSEIKNERIGQLAIPASSAVFAAFYQYQEAVIEAGLSPQVMSKPDSQSGLSPHEIVSIAQIIRFRAPEDRNPKIRQAHNEAVDSLPGLRSQLQWQDLLVKWGTRNAA